MVKAHESGLFTDKDQLRHLSVKVLLDKCLPIGRTYEQLNSTKVDIEEEGLFERNS